MKVLLGHSGGELSWEALRQTVERAAAAGDSLTVAIYDDDAVGDPLEDIESQVRAELADAGIDAAVRRLEGHVGGALVELADGEDFDRLVVAGGSRSALGKIQLGSVAEFVVLNAETPVTLIR
ncbi:universal stress protein [Halapricum salinum]|uniref:Universal stress protein n=1 Tax=Halapricum salinum TaxID=1457250 RepID=A0A4D6HCZ1_9EURY|nr:universal stress protein [Halapricum salinum]QCC50587.1 universal stress protein [Halapricum salinum]